MSLIHRKKCKGCHRLFYKTQLSKHQCIAERKPIQMKPIAVVHWQEQGTEMSLECYNQKELTFLSDQLMRGNYVFITCMCDIKANVPSAKPRKVRTAV